MHELYLAEKILNAVLEKAEEEKASTILETTIIIPENEHFTEKEFKDILKTQAEGTLAEKTEFKVLKENCEKIYIKDIKIK